MATFIITAAFLSVQAGRKTAEGHPDRFLESSPTFRLTVLGLAVTRLSLQYNSVQMHSFLLLFHADWLNLK